MANTTPQTSSTTGTGPGEQFDAIIIGAGLTGLYQLYKLRQLGLSVRVYEAGSGVGGTWYWNRYPGARFDSESYSYGYSFSEELLQEWDWKEHFSGQPENERYLNYVADKFDLRRDIQFNARVASALYDERANRWQLQTEDGHRAQAQFLITAVGVLSAPQMPNVAGLDTYTGEWCHTGLWPKTPLNLAGKRVGVIGTGASGVQLITEIAKEVGHLTVFQRTPNYCAPLHNKPIDEETQKKIKASYPEIFKKCRETFAGMIHHFDPRSVFEVSAEEREAFYEQIWSEPGFRKWLGNFRDVMSSKEANDTFAEFVRNKIRARVKDPAVANKLVPTNHPFGSKRVPLESGYYEVYNQDNVVLVDLKETPITRITPKGLKTSTTEYEFDVLIFATGFDAVTGAFNRINIRGVGGQGLKDKWADGPRTYLGIQSVGFPNLFTLVGPHNGATFCNIPRCSEQNVEWVTDCIRYMREHNHGRIEAKLDAEGAWTAHVADTIADSLLLQADSWFMGANTPGKKRTFLMYAGGTPAYRAKCDEVAAKGYEGFALQ
ncbi:MAG: NAD(P)/FAD-dependent oxidoreductase [Deltaproteobacteria bacterium]|nr:NAD(P)/FAD-dependent oxidoreductase [Deltaproteobacteria bacterium]